MKLQSRWAALVTLAALGPFVLAAGCSAEAPARFELVPPFVEVRPAVCVGRAACARVCVAGEARRCMEAAAMWERGYENATADLVKAARLYQRACDATIADGCRHVEAVIAELHRECDESPGRCADLGEVYEHGIGVLADLSYAAHFYKMACDAAVQLACLRLGALYDEGRGVVTDWTQAARLYEKACRGGLGAACNDLGYLYEHGRGVGAPDAKRARELYRDGCERGSGRACTNGKLLDDRASRAIAMPQPPPNRPVASRASASASP